MADDYAYKAVLTFDMDISANEITVILNGETYIVPKEHDTKTYYGTKDLVNSGNATYDKYPFCITTGNGVNEVYVTTDIYNNHNPFTIKIMEDSATTTDCFEKAVQACPTESVLTSSNPIFKRKQIGCTNAQAVTIQPKARAHLFCGTSETIEYPTQTCWGSIEIGTNVEGKVLAIPNKIVGNGVYLDIYNFTDNAVTLAANAFRAQVVTFPSTDPKTACAVLGQCESGTR